MRRFGRLIAAAALGLAFSAEAMAQGLPDPATVAPQYRGAAEKRRAEVMRMRRCTAMADKDNVLKRDLATYINRCVEANKNAPVQETKER